MASQPAVALIGPKVAFPTPWTAYFNPELRVWEMIDQNGIVVDPTTSQELTQLFVRLVNDAAATGGKTRAELIQERDDLEEELKDVRAESAELEQRAANSLSPAQANEQVTKARDEAYLRGRKSMQDEVDEWKRIVGILVQANGGAFGILGRDLEASPITGVKVHVHEETGNMRLVAIEAEQAGG